MLLFLLSFRSSVVFDFCFVFRVPPKTFDCICRVEQPYVAATKERKREKGEREIERERERRVAQCVGGSITTTAAKR